MGEALDGFAAVAREQGGGEAHAYRTFAHISKRSLDRHVNGDGEL
jgi:hypothetical protein